RVPSGWPVRKDALHRAHGLRCVRSPRLTMRHGFRNSRCNAQPIFRVADGEAPGPRNAASSDREMRNPSMPRGTSHHISDSPLFRDLMELSKGAVPLSTRHQERTQTRPRGTELAVFGSSKSTRVAAVNDHLPN